MQKITPHLWFDKEAREAAEFYVSLFGEGSKVTHVLTLENTPSGSVEVVSFEILGTEFQSISAGPYFKFNPSVSFHVICKTKEKIDELWSKFSKGGKVLMELAEYPFSKRYGWIQDKYGLSWQLIYVENVPEIQRITPVFMFVQNVCGKAEEAIQMYASVFKNAPRAHGISEVRNITRYNKGELPDKEGTARYADFSLAGMKMGAMDSALAHDFNFNEAISFIVNCETQEEIDYYWGKLSADPKSEQCGWLKDKYGVSWQIVPRILGTFMSDKDAKKVQRVTEAFLKMKKFDIQKLKQAYEG